MKKQRTIRELLLPFYLKNKHDEALQFLMRYLRSHKKTVEAELELAFIYYHLKQDTKAIKLYKKILQNEKNAITAMQFLSRACVHINKKEALLFAQVAHAIYPNFIMSNNLANIYDICKQEKEVEQWYRISLKLATTKTDKLIIMSNLALFYKKIKKSSRGMYYAKKVLRNTILKNDPKYTWFLDTLSKKFQIKRV